VGPAPRSSTKGERKFEQELKDAYEAQHGRSENRCELCGRHMTPNDTVERRGNALPSNETDLLQSSTTSLAHRSYAPRSLKPIVRSRSVACHDVLAPRNEAPPCRSYRL
jgi:hypothetical protein